MSEQDAAMLQDGAATAALSAAGDFCVADDHVEAGAALEAKEGQFGSRFAIGACCGAVAIERGGDAAFGQCGDERLVTKLV